MLVFFTLLAEMVQMDQLREPPKAEQNAITLFALQEDSALELRKRSLPEPPQPEPEQPPMPSVSQPELSAPVVESAMPDLALPDVGLESSFQLDVDISQFKPGQPDGQGLSITDNPVPLSRVNPRYPRKALRRNLEGEVVLEFTVDASGNVLEESIKVVRATPEGVFERNSIQALARWRFQPRQQGGQAVPFRARQTLVYTLAD